MQSKTNLEAPRCGLSAVPRACWALAAILLLALGLRLVLVHYGMPQLLYEDEPIYYNNALGFGLGHWIIPYFRKPPFFLYFYYAFYYLGYLVSPYMHWRDYVDAFWRDPAYIATIGRSVSVFIGVGAIALLVRIGRRLFSWPVGLAAAFLLAVDPTHLKVSPVVISDIPALLCILGGAWFAFDIAERGRWRDYLLCALMVTLAVSFKYNAFSAVFLVAGHLARERGQRMNTLAYWKSALGDVKLWLSLVLIPVAFALLNPMIFSDPQKFWFDLNWEKRHMLVRNPQDTSLHWQFMAAGASIFLHILPKALGWPLYVFGLLGFPWMLWRYPRRSLVLLSFPVLFLLIVLQFQLINAKYLLPTFPFFFLGAAVLLHDALSRLPKPWPVVGLIVILSLIALPSITDSLSYVAVYRHVDTRGDAANALQTMATEGDRFLLEPNTVTLDNRIIRRPLIIADYHQHAFQSQEFKSTELKTTDLATVNPRYVLLDFGRTQKQRDSQGNVVYAMPYPPAYTDYLQTHYQFRQIFAPYTIRLSAADLSAWAQSHSLADLYAKIQKNKTDRTNPGPLLLLLQHR